MYLGIEIATRQTVTLDRFPKYFSQSDAVEGVMEYKTCSLCNNLFPFDSEHFQVRKNRKSGLGSFCKKCYKIKYTDANNRQKEKVSKWRSEHKEIIKKRNDEYYWKKKEEIAFKRKLKRPNSQAPLRRHFKDHEERKLSRNIRWSTRQSKKLNLERTITESQWIKIKEIFNNKCCYCGSSKKLTQDHFIALTRNGEYTHNNIVPACGFCNSSKGNRDFFEWYPNHKYYSKNREKKIITYLNYDNKIQQLELAESKLLVKDNN